MFRFSMCRRYFRLRLIHCRLDVIFNSQPTSRYDEGRKTEYVQVNPSTLAINNDLDDGGMSCRPYPRDEVR